MITLFLTTVLHVGMVIETVHKCSIKSILKQVHVILGHSKYIE